MEDVLYRSDGEILRVINASGVGGFTGERCVHCGKTANVLAGHFGWRCCCGHFNFLESDSRPQHEHPDMGPSLAKLREIEQRRSERGVQQMM